VLAMAGGPASDLGGDARAAAGLRTDDDVVQFGG
jgi:hypothetical protein